MNPWPLLLAFVLGACSAPAGPPDAQDLAPRDTVVDWSALFAAEGAVGAAVLLDVATGQRWIHNPDRAATRFTPASTSKVFNGLVFLDQGVIADPDSLIRWDGVERSIAVWNQDHSLRTGTEFSAVWMFQRLALRVGRAGYADVFAREPYGNATLSDSLEWSWLDGTWRISAEEQVTFFDRLRRGDLAFDAGHQATARDVLPTLDTAGDAVLRGKTGWGIPPSEPQIGWLAGWVERPEGDVVYAMNLTEAPAGDLQMGPARLRVLRALLAEAQVFPGGSERRP